MTTEPVGTVVGQMLPEDLQRNNERRFSAKHIDGYLDKAIREHRGNEDKVHIGVRLLTAWLSKLYYPKKNIRLAQIKQLNLEELVRNIFAQISYYQVPTLFVSVTAQLTHYLGFNDKRESIQTIAEIMAVLCETDAFDISKASEADSLMVESKLVLPNALIDAIDRAVFLPPLVCEPAEITHNYESGYLTINECVILGRHNGHSGNVCLDALNLQNKVILKLDLDFLSTVEEDPTFDIEQLDQQLMWDDFKENSYYMYDLMVSQGNKFYLTNKYDKRGRMYCHGYHITTQGSPFKKATIELHHEEIVEGVP